MKALIDFIWFAAIIYMHVVVFSHHLKADWAIDGFCKTFVDRSSVLISISETSTTVTRDTGDSREQKPAPQSNSRKRSLPVAQLQSTSPHARPLLANTRLTSGGGSKAALLGTGGGSIFPWPKLRLGRWSQS